MKRSIATLANEEADLDTTPMITFIKERDLSNLVTLNTLNVLSKYQISDQSIN